MRRATTTLLAVAYAVSATAAACTLDINAPIEPPPEIWDPAANTHPDAALFQDLLDEYVHQGLPGVVLLVRTPEGAWNGAAGYAKLETSEPMLPTHRHHAASVTKMYTAAATLLLVEDGVIELDAPIREYLPEEVYRPIPNGSEATVRQLLNHTSGIPDFSGDIAYDLDFLSDPMGSFPAERLLSYLHGQSAWSAPGSSYWYSNANYYLLALLLDEVAAGGHARVVSERILGPLGLDATYYKNEAGYPDPPGLVNSYQDLAGDGRLMNVTDMAVHNLTIFAGNAGLVATSADFADFLDGLLAGALLGPEILAEMQAWGEHSRYGLGLSYRETDFGPAVGHDGGDVGARAQVRRFPDHDATLVLLSNGGDGGEVDRLFGRLWEEAVEAALGGV